MEAMYSSETSVDTQRITQHYIPEDGALCYAPKRHNDNIILTLRFEVVKDAVAT
jgi:hypothetical protein